MIWPEDAVDAIMKNHGVSLGEAKNLLKEAREKKDPATDQIIGVDDYLKEQFSHPLFAERFAAGAARMAGLPVAAAASLLEWSPEPLKTLAHLGEDIPPGVKLPLVGDVATAAGELVGSAIPFGLLDKAAAPAARAYAAYRSGIPGSILEHAAKGGIIDEILPLLGKGGISAAAKGQRAYVGARAALSVGAIGALQDPEHPLRGAAGGLVAGRLFGALENIWHRPLAEFKGKPDLDRAIRFLAGVYHEKPEVVASKYKNLADIQADLINKNGQPLNPEAFYSQQQWGELGDTSGVPHPVPTETKAELYTAVPEERRDPFPARGTGVPPATAGVSPGERFRAHTFETPGAGPELFPQRQRGKRFVGPPEPPLWWERGERVERQAVQDEAKNIIIEDVGGLKFKRTQPSVPEEAVEPERVSQKTLEKRRKIWEEAEAALNRKEAREAEIAAEQDFPRSVRTRDPFNLKKAEERVNELVRMKTPEQAFGLAAVPSETKIRGIPSEVEQQAAVQAEKATRGIFEAGAAIRKGEPPPAPFEKSQWGEISPTTDLLNKAADIVRGSNRELPDRLEALGTTQTKAKFNWRETIKNNRGSVAGEKTGKPRSGIAEPGIGKTVPGMTRKAARSLSAEDMKSVLGEWGLTGREVIEGADVDPGVVFSDPNSKAFANEFTRTALDWKSMFRIPAAHFSRDAESARWYDGWLGAKKESGIVQRQALKKLRRWADDFGIKGDMNDPEDVAKQEMIHKAIQGHETVFSYDADGKPRVQMFQRNDVPDWADKAARRWRQIVPEDLFTRNSGYRPEAEVIVKGLGMGPDRNGSFGRVMKKLQDIQNGTWTGRIRGLEQEAADATKGLIDINSTHDLSIMPYDEGVWSLLPIPQERRRLQEEIASLEEQMKLGVKDSRGTMDADVKRLVEQKARLAELEKQLANKGKGQFAGQNVLPGRQWYSPVNQLRDPNAAPFQIDPNFMSLSARLIHGMTTKRMFDIGLKTAREAMPKMLDDGSIKRYLVDYLQAQRGLKAYHDDQFLRNLAGTVEKYFGWDLGGERGLRHLTANIMKFQVLTRLFGSFRFGLFVNPTQPFQTTWAVVPTKIFFRAWGRTLGDLTEFLNARATPTSFEKALRLRNNVWFRALREGTIDEGSEQFLREAQGMGVDNWMDWLMQKLPTAKAASISESINRVHAKTAGEMDFMSPGFRVPAAVKKFFPEEIVGTPTWKQAKRYGEAVKNTTQFILQREGKPLGMQGGALNQLMFQFKSFTSGYLELALSTFKEAIAEKGGWLDERSAKRQAMKLVTATAMLGGGAVFPGYEILRHTLLKKGIINLPENNGFSMAMQMAGLSDYAPHYINIGGSFDPLNLPFSASERDILSAGLGPTVGPIVQTISTISREGISSKKAAQAIANMYMPAIGSGGLDVLKEIMQGGVKSDSGKLLANRSTAEKTARILGLETSGRGNWYKHRDNIKNALESGRDDWVEQARQDARDEGYIFTYKDLKNMRAEIKGEKKKTVSSPMDAIR